MAPRRSAVKGDNGQEELLVVAEQCLGAGISPIFDAHAADLVMARRDRQIAKVRNEFIAGPSSPLLVRWQ